MNNLYSAVFNDIKHSGISWIMCVELYKKYRSAFKDNYELFRDFLMCLEENGEARIIRSNFDDDLFHSVKFL